MIHHRPWIVAVGCAAIAISLLCWFHQSQSRPNENTALAAQDEVYEAVVRYVVTPTDGQLNISQLVFDDPLLTYFDTRADEQISHPAKKPFASGSSCKA